MATKRAGMHKVMRRHFMESLGKRDGHGWTCFYCHKTLLEYGDNNKPDSPAIEHRIPISKGGSDHMDNLRLACVECNTAKGTQTDIEFLSKVVRKVKTPQTPRTELSMELDMEWWIEVNHLRKQLHDLLHPRVQATDQLDSRIAMERKNRLKGADW